MITTTSYVDRQTDRQPRSGVPRAGDGHLQQLCRAIPGAAGQRHRLGPSLLGGGSPNIFSVTRSHKERCFPTVL